MYKTSHKYNPNDGPSTVDKRKDDDASWIRHRKNRDRGSYTDKKEIEEHRKGAKKYNPKKLVQKKELQKGWEGFQYETGGNWYYRKGDKVRKEPPYISTAGLDRSDVMNEQEEAMGRLKRSKKKAPKPSFGTTPSERKKENKRIQALVKKKKEEREEKEREEAARIKRAADRERATREKHAANLRSLTKQPNEESGRALAKKRKEETAEAARIKAAAKAKKDAEIRARYKKNLQKQQEERNDELIAFNRRKKQVADKKLSDNVKKRKEAKQRLAAAAAEKKNTVLNKACDMFFGERSFLYKRLNIQHNPEKLQDLKNQIVRELIKAEEMKSGKDRIFNMLANNIFLYFKDNSKIKGDKFDELLNGIITGSEFHTAYLRLHKVLRGIITTTIRDPIIHYKEKFETDQTAHKNFSLLMNKLYTPKPSGKDIMRTHLLQQNAAYGKNYLQTALPKIKSPPAKVIIHDNDVYSQTFGQGKRKIIKTNFGIDITGTLQGETMSSDNFDPKSLNTSQRNPIDSKFFTEGNYGQQRGTLPTLSRYFSYDGMIRSYEHNFYIPGVNTNYELNHKPGKLEYQTRKRSGTIEDNVWYSQKNDGQDNWVWKQSMKDDKKTHGKETGWKEIKDDSIKKYIGKPDNIKTLFKDFVKKQEKNPRYIIFKGITHALFRTNDALNERNPFHYGFIDTKRGIKLGDYIMFECINNYHETSNKAFLALQPPQKQTPLMFFIHKEHLNPPKKADEREDWAEKRSILSEYEYRKLFLNKLMDKKSQPLMKDIQSLTDFTTAGKYCEDENSINKNHTELCYSTGEKDKEGNIIYKSNVKFPEEQFKAMSGEAGILAIQNGVLVNFINQTGSKIEDLEKTNCTEDEYGEPCFILILDAYNKIAKFKTTTQQRLNIEMELLTDYTVFLHQFLDLNLTEVNEKQVKDEIVKVNKFNQTVTQMFNKLINSKELSTILKNLFTNNIERLINFKEIQLQDFKWLGFEDNDKRWAAIKHMEEEWKEQKTKFNDLMDTHFKTDLAEAAAHLKQKIKNRDDEIAQIIDEYNNASKDAHRKRQEEAARKAAELEKQAKLAKEKKNREEAARLKKLAKEKAKEVARLKKEKEEKAKRYKEETRKKVLLAMLKTWQETYEKEKREEERRILMEEIRENYNKAIEHNIKIRQEIEETLKKLGENEKELLGKADPEIYKNIIDVNSKWGTQISSLKDDRLITDLNECKDVFEKLLKDINDLLTEYDESHLSSHALDIKEFKTKLEGKIDKCNSFINEVKDYSNLLELKKYFGEDGEVVELSLGGIVEAIQNIEFTMNPDLQKTIDDVSEESIDEDPIKVPVALAPIIKEFETKLKNKEKVMKDVVSKKLEDINLRLTKKKTEMENILKKYGYHNKQEEEKQNEVTINIIKKVITLFGQQKKIMQEENNIEISIKDIFKEKEQKIPEDETREEEEKRMNLQKGKTNEGELRELEEKGIEKKDLEEKLNVQKKLLVVNAGMLKTQLDTLREYVNIDEFKKELEVAFKRTGEIFEEVDKIKEEYKADKDIDHYDGAEPVLINEMFNQFKKIIGDGFLKKKFDIEFINVVLENNLDKEEITIDKIEKIINGGDNENLDTKLIGAPDLLINITKFLLEDAIYNKSLLENNKHMALAEKQNAEFEQARLKQEEELKNKIKKQKDDIIEAERQAKLKAEAEAVALVEKERLEKLAKKKQAFQERKRNAELAFEEAETNYKKILSRYSESKYSKETKKELNDELMEMIFKAGLLHSDQKYMEKKERKRGVEDWFDTTREGQKLLDPDDPGYEYKLKKYNEAMKETNEIFG